MILTNQQVDFDKAYLGFRSNYNQKIANNIFWLSSFDEIQYCHSCHRIKMILLFIEIKEENEDDDGEENH